MNIGEIAERFIRAAEIDRNMREHVGPSSKAGYWPHYVHDQADKNGWGKSPDARIVKRGKLIQGDWLAEGEDPLAAERKAFWERMGIIPTAAEISAMDLIFDWLQAAGDDGERRALLAWARSKVGGKSFRRWCFQIEGIHPETGRRRKDRALAKIQAKVSGRTIQNDENREIRVLRPEAEIGDIRDTVAEDAGKREGLNNWAADDAFSRVFSSEEADFSWSDKRNAHRRRREAAKRKRQQAQAA